MKTQVHDCFLDSFTRTLPLADELQQKAESLSSRGQQNQDKLCFMTQEYET